MKMVLARCTGKRSLRDQPLEENDAMKRTRVHAQRKFAQGAAVSPVTINKDIKFNGAPSASDAGPSKHSGSQSEISEILPSKRPNTEDFLTFLCFRNTSILPARLDFFGAASASTSVKSSGSARKASKEGAAVRSAASSKAEQVKQAKDKNSTSKMSALKQKYRERELLRNKKMNASKHAQRASVKRLPTLADRKTKSKTSPGTKRSLRNEINVRKVETAKKKVADSKKAAPKSRESSAVNKTPPEAKKPVPVKPQVKNVKPSLVKNTLKSKAKRAPLNLRRGLRSGGGNPAVAQELSSKSKRLQVIRNRKSKLGAEKKTPPSNAQSKTVKRTPPAKVKSLGSDFSSEDDQPLVKKQRTRESAEKPSSSSKVPDSPLSPRPSRKTKDIASPLVESAGKDAGDVKKPISGTKNVTAKSQEDTSVAKRIGTEKDKKGKAEVKPQGKERTLKKEQSDVENSPKENPNKAKLKRSVIVKKNTVIANRSKKGKLVQAMTRSHSRLQMRILNQKKAKTRQPNVARSGKAPEKPEAEKVPSTPDPKPENTVSTRAKLSQTSSSKKQNVESVSKAKDVKVGTKSLKTGDKSSSSPEAEKSKSLEKKEKVVADKVKKPLSQDQESSEKAELVNRSTRRNSVPSVSPPPQIPKNKNKPKDVAESSGAHTTSPAEGTSVGKSEPAKKGAGKGSQASSEEVPAGKTKNVGKTPASKKSSDAHDSPSSDKNVSKASEAKSSKQGKKEQNSAPALRSRPSEKRLSFSSDEEVLSKLSILKNIDKSGDKAKAKNKSGVEPSPKGGKTSNAAGPKAKKLKKSRSSMESSDHSESEVDEPGVKTPKSKKKNEAKSVQTSLKKSNALMDVSSSEDDKMEDLLNLAALKTNLSKKTNLSAKGEKNTNLTKKSNLSGSNDDKNLNLSKKSNLSADVKEKNTNLSKKSNLSVSEKEKEKNILKAPPVVLKEKSVKFPEEKKDAKKSSGTDPTLVDKNVSLVTNLLTAQESADKKVLASHSNDKIVSETFNTAKSEPKRTNRSPSPSRRSRAKVSKSNLSLAESSKSEKDTSDLNNECSSKSGNKKGPKTNPEPKGKAESSEKWEKNIVGTPKEGSLKVNTAIKDKVCVKSSDKSLFSENELKSASNSIASNECSSVANSPSRSAQSAPSKDQKRIENNLPTNKISKCVNDEVSQVKNSNVKSQVEVPVKTKNFSQINLLDTKVPNSEGSNSSQPSTSLEPKFTGLNSRETRNLDIKETNEATSKKNFPQQKDSNQLHESKTVKGNLSDVKDANKPKDSNKAPLKGNLLQDVSQSKESNKMTPIWNLPQNKDHELKKTTSKGNLFEAKGVKQPDESHKTTTKKNLPQIKDLNEVKDSPASKEVSQVREQPKELLKTTSKKNVALNKGLSKSEPKETTLGLSQVNDVKQAKQPNAAKNEPNESHLSRQNPVTDLKSSNSSKIVNKLEAEKKEAINLSTPKKSAPKDLPQTTKNVDQVVLRHVPEPTQEDLVAASESLIRLSMSHVPYKSNFFGSSPKANNKETINVSSLLTIPSVPMENSEKLTPFLKNINTSAMSSPEKGAKYDFLKKCDNTAVSTSKTHGELNKKSTLKGCVDKKFSDVPCQLRNDFSSPSTSKFGDANRSIENNLQSQNLEFSQQSSLLGSLVKKSKTEPRASSQSGSFLGTNNLQKTDGVGSNTFIGNQGGNQLQSKKVENIDAVASDSVRKNKPTNLTPDVADKSARSKALNLETSLGAISRAKDTTTPKATTKVSNSETEGAGRSPQVKNAQAPKDAKVNVPESEVESNSHSRARRQSLSKSSFFGKEDEVDKKRSKSSGAALESASPPVQRRSGRIREPSSPRRKSRSPSPPPQRVLRARKSTYFGEVDSSDEDEDFAFLIASGKFLNESDPATSPKGKDKNVNKDTFSTDKKDDKKLVLSKRNNVAEPKSLKVLNQDGSQEGLADASLKKIDNKNQDVEGAKSKLEEVSRGKMNFELKSNVSDRRHKPTNQAEDDFRTSRPVAATSSPETSLKNTNTLRHESSSSQPTKTPLSLHQNEAFPAKTQNSPRHRAEGTNQLQGSSSQDSKSINTQITNFLHRSPAKSASEVLKSKNVPNNSPSHSNLSVTQNASGTATCRAKETNVLQSSFSLSVKETNIAKTDNKNVLAPNTPANKTPEAPKMSNIDPSMIPNNPRTYFNRSLAAAHLKSHAGDLSASKNLLAGEQQAKEMLKPTNKDTNSARADSKKGEEPRAVLSVPTPKSQNTPVKEKDTSALPTSEPVSDKNSPSKEPTASSSANLNASWKNAFKNLKLPKPYASVPKTPMDRNAWIKKHSAPLRLNKPNEAGPKGDPFVMKNKPNDIFSGSSLNLGSFSYKPSNFDVKTSTSGSKKPNDSSQPFASPSKKTDNEKPKPFDGDKKTFGPKLSAGGPIVKSITNPEAVKRVASPLTGEGNNEPVPVGKHQNLPVCIEQTLKHSSLKFSSPAKKSPSAAERDTSENPGTSRVTSSYKQFIDIPHPHNSRKEPNLKGSTSTLVSPEKGCSKSSPDSTVSPSKVKNPLSIENFIKPSSSSLDSSPKRTNNLSGKVADSKQTAKSNSPSGKRSSKPAVYGGISGGAEFFPEPQSQKPTYSSNPTLKKYSQSLSTSTRRSIDSELDNSALDLSASSEDSPEKVTKKVIFQQRRLSTAKELESPKKAVAFSPEHESSVYAFEPDLPPTSTPFRRNKIKSNNDSNLDSSSSSNNSIAVQVNLETEAVFECSTPTDVDVEVEEEEEEENEGQLFYIPLQQSVTAPSPQIQGVAVKLGTEGPDQRVIMRAKLVTKPPSNYAKKTAAVATNTVSSLAPLQAVSPELRKVRPLGASSVDSSAPVGTVQPTSRSASRDSPSPLASPRSSEHSSCTDLSMPSTSAASRSPKVAKRGKKSAAQANNSSNSFPKPESPGKIVEAPTFYPTEEEFSDPMEYIEQIKPMAEQFGLCRIVPPSNFKPECKVADDMRFTAYNQFVHRMLHRWGPSSKESAAIRKHLATENIALKNPPCIGGVELDLPQLYQKVQICGGLRKVIEQDRWQRVADLMKIPKSVHDRSSKLDEIYCKYLLPYDTLSTGERAKLFADVEKEWRHHKLSENELFDDIDDCIVKGRSMALNQFYRVARNIMTMNFGAAAADKEIGPDPEDVESQYWENVSSGQNHVCVHSASIDTGARGYGFPTTKNSTFAKHNWNLKILTNNSGSVLRSLGPIIGVTVPTLHVGMLFTTCCWYRDPHGLPWIEYLHTGASKIWYGIPAEYNAIFRSAMSKLLPSHKRSDQGVWLASDTAMVPPPLLVENGVSLSRVVQQPGQFIVVFPRAFTSSIATGYLLSESVYFAPSSWLQSANEIFLDLQNSCESSIFSLEQLLCSIASDSRTSLEILTQVAPLVSEMRDREVALRSQLEDLGLRATERLPRSNKRRSQTDEDEDYECEVCHANLFISLVSNSFEEVNYCLCHGIELLSKKRNHLKYCKLQYAFTEEELEEIIVKLNERIEQKSQKKTASKSSGSTPTK